MLTENTEKSNLENSGSDISFDKMSLTKSIEIQSTKPIEIQDKEISNLKNNFESNEEKTTSTIIQNLNKNFDSVNIEKETLLTKMDGIDLISSCNEEKKTEYSNNLQEINLQELKFTLVDDLLEGLDEIDKCTSSIIHDLQLEKKLELITYYFARIYNPDFIISYLVFVLFYKLYLGDFFFIFKPLFHTVICLVITLSLKKYYGRLRPTRSKVSMRIVDLRKNENNCSMPSGDSLQAGNFSVILYLYFNSSFGFYLIPFVMFARVYFYCHYVFDTIVGAFLGLLCSSVVYLILV